MSITSLQIIKTISSKPIDQIKMNKIRIKEKKKRSEELQKIRENENIRYDL